MAKEKETLVLNEKNSIDRDISWMFFDNRVLKEAMNEKVPLYERLNFLGIYSSNLDEFYKVRVASLKRISESKGREYFKERIKAMDTIKKISELTAMYDREYTLAHDKVFQALAEKGIHLVNETQLDDEQKAFVHDYYQRKIAGYINPIIITKKANLSRVNDSHIYLAVKMSKKDTLKVGYSLIPLPVKILSRFITLPDKDNQHYVMYVDDVVRYHLSDIFNGLGFDQFAAYAFKFSKDAEMEVESDPEEGILQSLTAAIKTRRKGMPIRAIFGEGIPDDLRLKLMKALDIDTFDLISIGGRYHNNKDLMSFPYFGNKTMKNPPYSSKEIEEIQNGESIIKSVLEKDRLVHVPYQSFDAFVRLLQEAAISSDVTAIKACIYRAAKDSEVVRALEQASTNGKKVTVMVELMARFDETSNILISQSLRDAGCAVLTGAEGFKVHGKIVLIKRKNGEDIAVVSTGNFHEGNARLYTDCLLFTADKRITSDVNNIFKFIAKPYNEATFKNLLVSPNHMQPRFEKLIENEIKNAKNGKEARIEIKINHITDEKMVKLLYKASQAGVKIHLLVRGNCSLVTGLRDCSSNIEIHGIIDRYLEHSRLFIFHNDGKPLYFLGSADWMPRNLYNRIEVVTPVYDEDIQKEIQYIFDIGFLDNTKSFILDGTGRNERYLLGKKKIRSQEELYNHYQQGIEK